MSVLLSEPHPDSSLPLLVEVVGGGCGREEVEWTGERTELDLEMSDYIMTGRAISSGVTTTTYLYLVPA
jgi:hypothetical protein